MELLNRIPFVCEDTPYEIRVMSSDNTINIVVFTNNYPATGYRHHIQIPKKSDPRNIIGGTVFNETVELAKSDIIEKSWERFTAVS